MSLIFNMVDLYQFREGERNDEIGMFIDWKK